MFNGVPWNLLYHHNMKWKMVKSEEEDDKTTKTTTKNTTTKGTTKKCIETAREYEGKPRYELKYLILFITITWFITSSYALSLHSHHHQFHYDQPAIYSSYESTNKSVNFTKLALDPWTDKIYVGASNWIYQFNSNLTLEIAVQTGPVKDSPLCSPGDCSGVEAVHLVSNINKILVIDHDSKMLISCGSVHQGACKRHRLNDIGQQEDLVPVPVASNDENSTTFAMIGPSRYFGSHLQSVLYVGATNSKLGPYRDMVPAISSRSLEPGPRLFSIIEKSFTDSARVDISSHLRDYYLVKYIYGFHSNDHVYFATVQRKSHSRALEEWGFITRLARICISDAGFHTYTEITLQCLGKTDGIDYNILQSAYLIKSSGSDLARDLHIEHSSPVLIGVFSQSKDHTTKPSLNSAICVYPLVDIEQKFLENMHLCYNGSVMTRDMDYIAGSVNQCPEPGKAGNILNFCNEAVKLNGSIPMTSYSLVQYHNTTLTSVTASTTSTSTGQHTVAFAGTSYGSIKKILISQNNGIEFEEVMVDKGHPILPEIYLDHEHHPKFLIVSSPYKIAKVKIERCIQHNNCDQCLQARNPYCGWCSLEKRCTVKSECNNATSLWGSDNYHHQYQHHHVEQHHVQSSLVASRWLSLETSQCIDFQAIKPNYLPYNQTSMVELLIYQLPQLPFGANYLCVFGSGSVSGSASIQAKVTRNGLSCMSPPVSSRPPIPDGKDHVTVNLAVRSTETETDFIHRSFIFYDCSYHKTCKSCVTSPWGCNWCQHENKCTDNASNCSGRIILGESNGQNSLTKGHHYCPSFNIVDEILIPNGAKRRIDIEVKNLVTSQVGFECIIEIEGAKFVVPAKFRDNKVQCNENQYTYQEEIGEMKAQLTVLWNGDTFIDTTNVTLYKCDLLGSHAKRPDCSLCHTKDKKYQCVWCSMQCSFVDSCSEPPAQTCPPPRIDWIHPLSGPVEGGTLVAIEGTDLGSNLDEIKDKILFGGVPCIPVEYNVSVRVVCRTSPSPSHGPQAAVVVIGNRAGVTRAQELFQYKMVELNDVNPNVGPQSGGTRLYLTGVNLNIGSSIEVFLDDLPCKVERSLASSRQLSCRTSPSPLASLKITQLLLRIDGANFTLNYPFLYTHDPIIESIYPLESFISGGRSIMVTGNNFLSIQQPKMIVSSDISDVNINETFCHVINNTAMSCPSPGISLPSINQIVKNHIRDVHHSNSKARFKIGFLMDDVSSVKELSANFPKVKSDLIYVPDPKLFPFDDGIKLYKGESLVIEGESLRSASTELEEVNVTIGNKNCLLTSLASTQLVCMPPDVQPEGTDEIGRKTPTALPLVVVRIGSSLRYEIGYLQYELIKLYELPPFAMIAVITSSLILILFVLIALVVMRHKSSQAEREYKIIQMQMDTLENSVRSECKQAFAELQTDMTDLTNDLESQGIPTLDHRTYVMKVFFPGVNDHPLYQGAPRIRNGINGGMSVPVGHADDIYEVAMAQFEQLIYNKSFIITFINTLESQKTFSIRDRVNVASLIMIILMERMEYATDILKTLLYQLIDKSVASKHPQLMLRRTESVVEKMLTNWLALSMYEYMKDQAGSSLFLLFSALKRQVEKGPIDEVTHDARYSISEERLLREHYCDFEQIVIQIYQENQDEKILCRVNDCDTITQVKAKLLDALYKNTPFSLRPSVNEVDLEWRHGRGGHLTLTDKDLTTKIENGWMRINSLRHYGVKNYAVMSLVMRHSNDSYISTLTRNSMSPIISMGRNHFDDRTDKHWHLVKPNDDCHHDHLHKAIPEIFLTRLLATKVTVQKFVDDFFMTIFSVNDSLPAAIKWIFYLLDDAAHRHGISDPEVIHAWKSNCLPLRFWVNFIKNPDFILDINKTQTLDSCLSVIAQTLMDSCSTSEHRLGKDSPSTKLLFAKDIPNYRRMVSQFYKDISSLRSISEQELSSTMQYLSMAHRGEFDTNTALKELFVYAAKYNTEILNTLQMDIIDHQSINKFANLIKTNSRNKLIKTTT